MSFGHRKVEQTPEVNGSKIPGEAGINKSPITKSTEG